jgi:hypothetical protein
MRQTALPVAEKLDPFQAYLPYKLFRESTRYVKGKVVKVCSSFLSKAHGIRRTDSDSSSRVVGSYVP